MSHLIRIATRRSRLALWQAEHVARLLSSMHDDVATELVPMTTRGDKILDRSLAKVGGKGLFIKELEQALLDGRADIAVHSMKDVPAEITHELQIAAVLHRENPLDAFVSNDFPDVDGLPDGARVGTSSLRRASQLLAMRPDLRIVPLRGNVETRLSKVDAGECDATVLAIAGLSRLSLDKRVTAALTPLQCLPAIGQGAIGIECRQSDERVVQLLEELHDARTWRAVEAERAVGAGLRANCQSPVAAYAREEGQAELLEARVLTPDGRERVEAAIDFSGQDPQKAGLDLASKLLADGAGTILAQAAST